MGLSCRPTRSASPALRIHLFAQTFVPDKLSGGRSSLLFEISVNHGLPPRTRCLKPIIAQATKCGVSRHAHGLCGRSAFAINFPRSLQQAHRSASSFLRFLLFNQPLPFLPNSLIRFPLLRASHHKFVFSDPAIRFYHAAEGHTGHLYYWDRKELRTRRC